MLDEVASSNHQSLVAWLYHNLFHGIRDLSFKNRFHLCGWYVNYLLDNSLYLFYVQAQGNHSVAEHLRTLPDVDLLDVDLILPYCPLYFTNAQVLPTDDAKGHSLQPKPKMYEILAQRAQYNKFIENGSKN